MDLCNDGHPEICYDERICPLCDAIEDRASEVKVLEDEIGKLNDQVKELENAE